jgi:hypothetical protein
MNMAIQSCKGCVPPKRTPTCKFDGSCNKYAEAKKKHDTEKAIEDQKKAVNGGLTSQMLKGVNRAQKARRRKKGK